MNINEIIEVQELARVFAGTYASDSAQQDANQYILEGSFPVYIACRRRQDPSIGGMTSQFNTAEEYAEYAVSGSTAGYAASQRATGATSYNPTQGDWDPIFMQTASTKMTSAWDGVTVPSTGTTHMPYMQPPHFSWMYGGTYQNIDPGNYTPTAVMMIPVRNTTDTDIVVPATQAYLTSMDATYGSAYAALIVAGGRNPTISDPAVVTELFKGNVSNGNQSAIPSFTIPAQRSAILVLVSHFINVKGSSNSYAWSCRVGPQVSLWYHLTQTSGLVPDFNAGWGLMFNKGTLSNTYAGLFKNQEADLAEGAR